MAKVLRHAFKASEVVEVPRHLFKFCDPFSDKNTKLWCMRPFTDFLKSGCGFPLAKFLSCYFPCINLFTFDDHQGNRDINKEQKAAVDFHLSLPKRQQIWPSSQQKPRGIHKRHIIWKSLSNHLACDGNLIWLLVE